MSSELTMTAVNDSPRYSNEDAQKISGATYGIPLQAELWFEALTKRKQHINYYLWQ